MKPGRNAPCPCGSGKKYKRCCNLIEQAAVQHASLNQNKENEDEIFKNQELWLNALNNLRKFTLDKKLHIKEYYKIRNLHSKILGSMVQYHEDGKFELKKSDPIASRDEKEVVLQFLQCDFDMDTQLGYNAFYDMLVYKTITNASCITEDFIRKNRYRKPEKIEFLHSMLDSKLGLYEIVGADSAEGYVYLKEVFTGEEYKIIDIGLSGSQNFIDIYMYQRIITYHGISFNAGFSLIFAKSDDFINRHIQQHKKNYNPDGEFYRFTQLYNRYLKHPGKLRVVTNKLK